MIVAGNWKMNMGLQQAIDFLSHFKKLIAKEPSLEHFIFFPPASLSFLFQKEKFYWGGQNIYSKAEGSFTGETSAKNLKEMGASFCLLGHSERRYIFGESDSEIEKKFHLLQELALIPILCVGESLADRFDKKKILKRQLSWIKNYEKYKTLPWKSESLAPAFKSIPFIIAYEPLWSIGTGDVPSAQEINETAQFIKEYLAFPSAKVLYGGSVDVQMTENFPKASFVDGFLIGKASLDPDSFYKIYKQLI